MVTTTISKMETVWNTFQEPRCSTYLPNSYMLLLSALDDGWKVVKVELTPSWDQYGFVYLVTLKNRQHPHSQQLILPQKTLVTNLLYEHKPKAGSARQRVRQPA